MKQTLMLVVQMAQYNIRQATENYISEEKN